MSNCTSCQHKRPTPIGHNPHQQQPTNQPNGTQQVPNQQQEELATPKFQQPRVLPPLK